MYKNLYHSLRWGHPLLLFFFMLMSPAWAANYYVDANNGKDTNNGLSTNSQGANVGPWKTMDQVMDAALVPGDSVFFKRGGVWNIEIFRMTKAGANGKPIYYGAYGTGNKPEIINGYISIENSYTVVENMVSRNSPKNGIARAGGQHVVIRGCEVYNPAKNGIRIKGLDFFGYEDILVEGCYVDGAGIDNITVHRDQGLEAGMGYVFLNNISVNAGEEGFDFTTGSDIFLSGNMTEGNGKGSIVCGHGVENVHITQHFSYNDNTALKLKRSENIRVETSIFTGPKDLIKFDDNVSGPGLGSPSNIEVYNCVFWQTGSADIMDATISQGPVTFKNNIFGGTQKAILNIGDNKFETNYTFDYNLYFAPGANKNYVFIKADGNLTLDDWASSYGNGVHSFIGDPTFINGSGAYNLGSDFDLKPSSPAINAGITVGVNADYHGGVVPQDGSPDLGAYEFDTGVFPVEWLDFQAAPDYQKGLVQLKWSTASELNNQYFTVEASRDELIFKTIATRKAIGTSNQVESYEAADMNPLPGVSWYRIRQTDIDGSYSYSSVISAFYEPNQMDLAKAIRVYPTLLHAGENFFIEAASLLGEEMEFMLMDMQGKRLWGGKYVFDQSPLMFQLPNHLDSGNYVISIRIGRNQQGFRVYVYK